MKRHFGRGSGLLLACVVGLSAGARAQPGDGERGRIERERAAVEMAFAAQDRACQERFAVTACVEDARRTRRSALAELRRQATALDETQRRQRAERRRQLIQDNLAREAADRRETTQRPARELPAVVGERSPPAEREPRAVRPVLPKTPAARSAAVTAPAPANNRAAQETRHRARFEARQRDARMHQDEVRQRNEAAAERRPPAAPLPVPVPSKP
jgi:hypothetical protein